MLLRTVFLLTVLCASTAWARARLGRVAMRQNKYPNFTETGCMKLPTLVCNVQPTEGAKTNGVVYFSPIWHKRTPDSDKFTCYTRITAAIAGLTAPSHGFHVHTYGDLSNADGTSTGGHFSNPAGDEMKHGMPSDKARHWGDFGNLENDGTGMATYDRVDMVMRLGGVVGRAITIHAENDKGSDEQPSGAAGARVGYCVIGYANPDVITNP